MAIKKTYSVVVGNIGQVYRGGSKSAALKAFSTYVKQSKSGKGRAGGEGVDLYDESIGDVIKSHYGTYSEENPTRSAPKSVIPSRFISAKVRRVGNKVQILLNK